MPTEPRYLLQADALITARASLEDLYERIRSILRDPELRGGDAILLVHPVKAPFLEMHDSLTEMAREIRNGDWSVSRDDPNRALSGAGAARDGSRTVTDERPMSGIYQFGPEENPRFKATNGRGNRAGTHWCCPINKGHNTPAEAAQHLARRMTLEWAAQGETGAER